MKCKTEVAKEIAKKHGSRDLIVILGGGGVVKNQEIAIVHNKTAEAFSEELMNSLHSVASKREIKNPFKEEDGCQLSSRYAGSLISGKEAKLVWANGDEVQLKKTNSDYWDSKINSYTCSVFDNSMFEFRLKPRTISINGIEVPAPFEPKSGDMIWCISDDHACGYCTYNWHKHHSVKIGAWRTEDEIKQVVEALRSIFK